MSYLYDVVLEICGYQGALIALATQAALLHYLAKVEVHTHAKVEVHYPAKVEVHKVLAGVPQLGLYTSLSH